jgi:hypothetical protein
LPVKKELLESFKAKKEELKRLLDAIPFGKEEVSLASVK